MAQNPRSSRAPSSLQQRRPSRVASGDGSDLPVGIPDLRDPEAIPPEVGDVGAVRPRAVENCVDALGRYEAGADIADDEWIRLKLDIDETRVRVSLNGKEAFAPTDLKAIPEAGGIGLWVGRGTEGYFSNLRITPR